MKIIQYYHVPLLKHHPQNQVFIYSNCLLLHHPNPSKFPASNRLNLNHPFSLIILQALHTIHMSHLSHLSLGELLQYSLIIHPFLKLFSLVQLAPTIIINSWMLLPLKRHSNINHKVPFPFQLECFQNLLRTLRARSNLKGMTMLGWAYESTLSKLNG